MALPFILSFFIFIFGVIGNVCVVGYENNRQKEQGKLIVFGYLPEYRYNNFDYENAFRLGVTHLIFFSLEVDPRSSLPTALDRLPQKDDMIKARKAANKYGAKIILSFGGNARSQGFDTMTSTNKRRNKFLSALNKLLVEYQMDGVDYNWEYPASDKEWSNWSKLLSQSKRILLRNASSDGSSNEDDIQPQNVVTFTMYADINHFNIVKKHKLLDHADYLHCMTYDARNKHSTVRFADTTIRMAKDSFQGLKDPSGNKLIQKWTLGVPFYGRDIINGQPATYYDIIKTLPAKRLIADKSLQPCITAPIPVPSTSDFNDDDARDLIDKKLYYNSRVTLRMKTNMAIHHEIGGIMIWELGQDIQPFGESSLLSAVTCGEVTPFDSYVTSEL